VLQKEGMSRFSQEWKRKTPQGTSRRRSACGPGGGHLLPSGLWGARQAACPDRRLRLWTGSADLPRSGSARGLARAGDAGTAPTAGGEFHPAL